RRVTRTRTRLQVPVDAIKLQDRLLHLLQPPVETWLANEALTLPFEPFPFQWEGIAFLYPRYAAVLSDEMGLGKTMQAITAVRLLLTSGEANRCLLICPKPLVANWVREFNLWAPELPVLQIEGNATKRRWQWNLENMPVRIANYELLARDEDTIAELEEAYDVVVLDEAQRIKNRSSVTSRVARSIPRQRSWALTGTPIENSADDLLGIFDFVSSGLLSPTMTPRRMGKLAGDYLLRRTKDQVLTDLPPKIFRDAMIDLTPEQHQAYAIAEESGTIQLSRLGESITVQHVFELVLRLKQICNFDPATNASAKADRLQADLEEVAASGKKAIVFSQWVQTIEELSERLQPFRPLQFHGKISPRVREQVLAEFRDAPDRHVLLMSYGAGSVGLNLQFAGYVFLFDRWWNPAVEDQAINRAHRIGAAGPVTITRFLAMGTIEERIDKVLEAKRALFDTVLSAAEGAEPRLGLTQNEIFGLFEIEKPPTSARST
ncbi:MAG: DEAD/DEAH box helicase, partial [Planctomycetota bacterium]